MSQENKLREIKIIVEQLKLLSIQQSELVTKLDLLTDDKKPILKKITAVPKVATAASHPLSKRALVIGDQVRIDNPRRLQPSTGEVIKLTLNRVTIQAANGTTIVRAAKNLTLI